LTAHDKNLEISEFAHYYIFSAYTDVNGYVNFKRPSSHFLILVDLATVPQNTGIDRQTIFYHPEHVNDKISITNISKIKAEHNEIAEYGVLVNIFNSNGESINADYSILINDFTNSRKSLLTQNSIEVTGSVVVGNRVEHFAYSHAYSSQQRLDYAIDAINRDEITKEDALSFYLDLYFAENETDELIIQLTKLYEDIEFFNQLSEELKETLNTIILLNNSIPSYNRTFPLNPSTSDYFVIHYTHPNPTLNTVPTFIQELAAAFTKTRSTLIGTGASQFSNDHLPRSDASLTHARYNIYVTADSSQTHTTLSNRPAVCRSWNDKTSIIMFFNITNLSGSLSTTQEGLVAHEYMHAIMNTYRNNGELPTWFKEAWSEWAAVRVAGMSSIGTNAVNHYLRTTWQSLHTPGTAPNTSREYGTVLLPLFLRKNHGGDTMVAQVVKNLSSTSFIDVYHAISLAAGGTSSLRFDEMFPVFAQANYTPRLSYDSAPTAWDNRPFLSADYALNSYPNNEGVWLVNPVSAHYRDFAVPASGQPNFRIDVTINVTSGQTSRLRCRLLMTRRIGGNVDSWVISQSGTTSLITISQSGLSPTTYGKGCVMLSNNDKTTNGINYRITIARS
jgi:hypothetical protein